MCGVDLCSEKTTKSLIEDIRESDRSTGTLVILEQQETHWSINSLKLTVGIAQCF